MTRKIYKLALRHILVNRRLCANLRCVWVQQIVWGIKISKIDFSYRKYCERYIKLWIMHGFTLLKLYKKLWTKNIFSSQFVDFLTQFRYYYNYYVIIWRKKFELSLEDTWIFYVSLGHGLEWVCESNYNFWAIFGILLNTHVVQFGINFDNHVEIYLTYRK
jgi:hypothetical protein